jgi:hypothetical protein
VRAARVALSLAALVAAWPAAATAGPSAEAYFTAPADGTVVQGSSWVRVAGQARGAEAPAATSIDVMLVIDTSGSTSNSAGAKDGIAGLLGGGPSILHAELEAARAFLDASDPATTRVGIVRFAGDFEFLTGSAKSGSVNAWVEQPLTADYAAVRATLGRIRQRGSHGGTDMAAGLRLAIRELLGLPETRSQARSDARKVALLLTDGFPTLPFGSVATMDPGDVDVTLGAARVAAKGGIVVHSFCLGPEALSAPMACREAARLTGGIYSPVERPADIVSVLPRTPVGRVELVAVRNATTGRLARSVSVRPDGGFTAEVELAPGANQLVVELHGPGPRVSGSIVVHYGGRDVDIEVNRKPEPTLELQIERPAPPGARPR